MRSSITIVLSEGIFGVFYDEQEDFEGSFEFDFILVSKFLVLIFVFLSQDMMASLNLALVKFSKFLFTTEEHIVKYGSYVSKEGINIVFNKCDISRMITVAAISADGDKSH